MTKGLSDFDYDDIGEAMNNISLIEDVVLWLRSIFFAIIFNVSMIIVLIIVILYATR